MRGRDMVLGVAVLAAGCFDSDEKLRAAEVGTSSTSTTSPSTSGEGSSTTTLVGLSTTELAGNPDLTCQDAIRCVGECIRDLVLGGIPLEPDLSCITDCSEMLTVDEAYDLLRLINCASEQCSAEMRCGMEGASTGAGSSSDDGASEPLVDPCLECILVRLQNRDLPGCEEFHGECR